MVNAGAGVTDLHQLLLAGVTDLQPSRPHLSKCALPHQLHRRDRAAAVKYRTLLDPLPARFTQVRRTLPPAPPPPVVADRWYLAVSRARAPLATQRTSRQEGELVSGLRAGFNVRGGVQMALAVVHSPGW